MQNSYHGIQHASTLEKRYGALAVGSLSIQTVPAAGIPQTQCGGEYEVREGHILSIRTYLK